MNEKLQTSRSATSWAPELKEFVDDFRPLLRTPDGSRASNAQIFFLAMAFGFSKGAKGPKSPRNSDAARFEYMDSDLIARMRMIAVADSKSSDVLESDDEVIDIAEQYANGGLALLKAEMESNPAFSDWLRSQLYQTVQEFAAAHSR